MTKETNKCSRFASAQKLMVDAAAGDAEHHLQKLASRYKLMSLFVGLICTS
jgi:hypothetical protein